MRKKCKKTKQLDDDDDNLETAQNGAWGEDAVAAASWRGWTGNIKEKKGLRTRLQRMKKRTKENKVSAVIVKKRTSLLCMLNGLFYNSSRPKIERAVMQMIQKMWLSHSHDGSLWPTRISLLISRLCSISITNFMNLQSGNRGFPVEKAMRVDMWCTKPRCITAVMLQVEEFLYCNLRLDTNGNPTVADTCVVVSVGCLCVQKGYTFSTNFFANSLYFCI